MENLKETTLYKKNKNNSIEEWNIQVSGNTIKTTWGKIGGLMQCKIEVISSGKNLGRANATTPEEQALFQAESVIKKKKDKGYSETISGAEESKLEMKPILVHDYTLRKNSEKIIFPCYVQPKLDGVRSQIFLEGDDVISKSRGNKVFPRNEGLFLELKNFMKENNLSVIDGEFYYHGEFLEDIISCVKKPQGNRLEDLIEFHIFDLPLNRGFDTYSSLHPKGRIKTVDTTLADNRQQAKELMDAYISQGYEGLILRNSSTYEADYPTGGIRTYNIQKWKEFMDEEFEIIDIVSDKVGHGIYVCQSSAGAFNVTPKSSHLEKSNLLINKDKYIGKMLTVRFQELTALGIPKFGRGIAIRDYE